MLSLATCQEIFIDFREFTEADKLDSKFIWLKPQEEEVVGTGLLENKKSDRNCTYKMYYKTK